MYEYWWGRVREFTPILVVCFPPCLKQCLLPAFINSWKSPAHLFFHFELASWFCCSLCFCSASTLWEVSPWWMKISSNSRVFSHIPVAKVWSCPFHETACFHNCCLLLTKPYNRGGETCKQIRNSNPSLFEVMDILKVDVHFLAFILALNVCVHQCACVCRPISPEMVGDWKKSFFVFTPPPFFSPSLSEKTAVYCTTR